MRFSYVRQQLVVSLSFVDSSARPGIAKLTVDPARPLTWNRYERRLCGRN